MNEPKWKLKDWIPFEKLNFGQLCLNPNAVDILLDEKNRTKIDWYLLSSNTNYKIIDMISQNLNKIEWFILSENPSAISILNKHRKKINWGIIIRKS